MQKFKFNKPFVESSTHPENINVYWVKKTPSTNDVKETLEFKDNNWVTLLKAVDLQDKTIKVTEKDYKEVVKPDEGFDGLNSVDIDVAVTVPLDFADIGYYDRDSVQADLAYSKASYEAWDPTSTSVGDLYYRQYDDIINAPLIDTSRVTTMGNMFLCCERLRTVPQFDTSAVTNMSNMFNGCKSLESVPLLNTSKVINMRGMFSNTDKLRYVPLFDSGKVTDMSEMFNGSSVQTVPLFDTSSVTSMAYMFTACKNLVVLPPFDTSKVIDMNWFCYNCSSLTTIPLFNACSVEKTNMWFLWCSKLTTVGGFTDLGKAFTSSLNVNFSWSPLSSGSVTNIANTVYDMNQNTSVQTAAITFKSTVYSALTDEQKTLFANKGWAIASA